MKPRSFRELHKCKQFFEEESDRLSVKKRSELIVLREQLFETISSLEGWLRRRLTPANESWINELRRQLLHLELAVAMRLIELEREEQTKLEWEVALLPNPLLESTTTRKYRTSSSIYGTDLWKSIDTSWLPVPHGGGGVPRC